MSKAFLEAEESKLLEHLKKKATKSDNQESPVQLDTTEEFKQANGLKADDDDGKKKPPPNQRCALFKKLTDKFTPPLIKRLGELKSAVKAGKFKIQFNDEDDGKDDGKETPKPTNKKDDDCKKPLILNFNSISFSPNEKLFPVEKQSNMFEMVAANEQIRLDYVIEESSNENTNLKTLNDCFLRCRDSKVACHSFAFCVDPAKSVVRCQLSSLYFEDSMNSLNEFDDNPSVLADDKSTTPSDNDDDDADYSKWLEAASGCSTFNLMFKNYFRPIDDRTMVEEFAFSTLHDYTLDDCLKECHFHAKVNESATENSMCRLVQHCLEVKSIDENSMEKRSTCMMSNGKADDLPRKNVKTKKNCQLFDCEFGWLKTFKNFCF